MIDVEGSFAQLVGRQPTEKEVQNLYRVKNALGIRDNDALWLVLMALESYDTLYRKYPSMIATQVETLVDAQKEALAAVANTEAKKALASLVDAVGRTSEAMAGKLVDAARWQAWGWTLIGIVVFGCLCLCVGVVIGSGRLPFWVTPRPDSGPTLIIVAALAETPAGWIVAVGGATAAVASAWKSRSEILAGRQLSIAISAIALIATAIAFLLPVI
jgi:hypothetical protein